MLGVDGHFFFCCGVEDLDFVFVGGVNGALDQPVELTPGRTILYKLFSKDSCFGSEECREPAFLACPFVSLISKCPAQALLPSFLHQLCDVLITDNIDLVRHKNLFLDNGGGVRECLWMYGFFNQGRVALRFSAFPA